MKKKSFKNLAFQKKTISNLENVQKANGGKDSFWPETVKFCPIPPEPEPIPPTVFPGDVCPI